MDTPMEFSGQMPLPSLSTPSASASPAVSASPSPAVAENGRVVATRRSMPQHFGAKASKVYFKAGPEILDLDLETRVGMAVKHLTDGSVKNMTVAAAYYDVPYHRLRSRTIGRHSRAENGGHQLLDDNERVALHTWAGYFVSFGLQVRSVDVMVTANCLLKSNGKEPKANSKWAKRFMNRHSDIYFTPEATGITMLRKVAQELDILEAKGKKPIVGLTGKARKTLLGWLQNPPSK